MKHEFLTCCNESTSGCTYFAHELLPCMRSADWTGKPREDRANIHIRLVMEFLIASAKFVMTRQLVVSFADHIVNLLASCYERRGFCQAMNATTPCTAAWEEVGLSCLRQGLDEQAMAIAENQESSLQRRKALATQAKSFRATVDQLEEGSEIRASGGALVRL